MLSAGVDASRSAEGGTSEAWATRSRRSGDRGQAAGRYECGGLPDRLGVSSRITAADACPAM